jgi:ribosomal protein L7/L12
VTAHGDLHEVISRLHKEGFTASETMRILRITLGLSLSEAKEEVVRHPVWKETVNASEHLHRELERELDSDSNT